MRGRSASVLRSVPAEAVTIIHGHENIFSAVKPVKVQVGNYFKTGKTIWPLEPFKTPCYITERFLLVSVCPYLAKIDIITIRKGSHQNFYENVICCLQKLTRIINSLFYSLVFAFVTCKHEHKVVYHLFKFSWFYLDLC